MNSEAEATGERLNALLGEAGMAALDPQQCSRFGAYCALLMRWNARTNLTAIRDEAGILSRHFVESIACARALPSGIATLLDFGSGGGFPGVPIALCRPEVAVTLAESQGKKAAFLQEAVRTLRLSAAVHAGRAEALTARFDCVTLRAVDRMGDAMRAARVLVRPGGWMALMTTEPMERLRGELGGGMEWLEPVALPGSEKGLLVLGRIEPADKD